MNLNCWLMSVKGRISIHIVINVVLFQVRYLVGRGARVFYPNNDPSCPLQLACKTPLLKASGQSIACLLVVHGANLEYEDIALRNTLFWTVYNNNPALAQLVVQCGIRVRPWSWVDIQASSININHQEEMIYLY